MTDPGSCSPDVGSAASRRPPIGWQAAFALGLLVAAAHGPSVWDGLFFDDHWHRTTLREYGWGFSDLVESATFDLPGRLTHLWWQERPLQWRYARPVAMLMMKVEYLISGGGPVAIHALALLWHWATAVLVWRLAYWALGRPGWALLAGAIFAIHPHAVHAVSWIAARNALVGGFFFAAAVLAYTRATVAAESESHERWLWWLPVSLALWGLALFSRETGIVFPVVAVGLDGATGGWRLIRRRIPLYAFLATLTAGYLYWRLFLFPVRSVPEIYFTPPRGWAYAPFALGRLVHLVFAQVFYTPMFLGLPTGGQAAGRIGWTYAVLLGLLGLIALWYAWASRDVRGRWLWPLWIVLGFVPVIPVFVMPHFSYLPAIPYAVLVTILLMRLRGRWRAIVTGLVLLATLWSHFVYRTIWRGILRSEQLIYADILAHEPAPPAGTKLFFINLPVAGIYAPVALREAWGVKELEGYVLTFAPHPLVMCRPVHIERLNERELRLSTPEPGYFSGLAGRMLLDGMRCDGRLRSGMVIPGEEFDTTVVAGDENGVTELRFTFRRPLDSPEYRFFVSTPHRPAAPVRFDARGPVTVPPAAPAWQQQYADWLTARDWYFRIVNIAGRIVRSEVLLTDGSE